MRSGVAKVAVVIIIGIAALVGCTDPHENSPAPAPSKHSVTPSASSGVETTKFYGLQISLPEGWGPELETDASMQFRYDGRHEPCKKNSRCLDFYVGTLQSDGYKTKFPDGKVAPGNPCAGKFAADFGRAIRTGTVNIAGRPATTYESLPCKRSGYKFSQLDYLWSTKDGKQYIFRVIPGDKGPNFALINEMLRSVHAINN